jgi:16S rRNA (uracil1498-N3)-methyltransferase
MTRFFIRPEQIDGDTVTLDSEDALHLDRVLRARPGDEIGILDGTGRLAVCKLTRVTKSAAMAAIVAIEPLDTEPRVAVTVAQAMPKNAEKLEWVLQHGVEVGAAGFVIFRGRRSEPGKSSNRPDRWAKIVKTAAEQAGRARLPGVAVADDLSEVLARGRDWDRLLFCDEAERERTIRTELFGKSADTVMVLVGPEGGWTDAERECARVANAVAITLGKRTLRTETAALVAMSQILFALDAG